MHRIASRLLRRLLPLALLALCSKLAHAEEMTCHVRTGSPDPAVTVRADTPNGQSVRSGEAVSVTWSLKHAPDPACRTPLMLMIAMHERVRFNGEGFIALPPGAAAPFGVRFAQSQMRVVVPLHAGAMFHSGRLEIMPFTVGALDLTWRIIEVPAIVDRPKSKADFAWGREVAAPGTSGSARIEVTQGKPTVVLQDPFTLEQPKKTIVHEAAGYEIHEYPKFFRVIERASGEMIAERVGVGPQFSPTGRFVISFGVPSDGRNENRTEMIVYDLKTGTVALDHRRTEEESFGGGYVSIETVRWAVRDAYLSVSHAKLAGITLVPTLIGRATKTNADGPNCCGALDSTEHFLDLEQFTAYYRMKEMSAGWTADSLLYGEGAWFEATSPAESKELAAIAPELSRLDKANTARHDAEFKAATAAKQEYQRRETQDDQRERDLSDRKNKLEELLKANAARRLAEGQLTPRGDKPLIDLRPRKTWDSGGKTVTASKVADDKAPASRSRAVRHRAALASVPREPVIAAGDRLRQRIAEWGLVSTRPVPAAKPLRSPARKDGELVNRVWFQAPLARDIPLAGAAVDMDETSAYQVGCNFATVEDVTADPHAKGFRLDGPRPAGVAARPIGHENVHAARAWQFRDEHIWLLENQCIEGTGGQLYGQLILVRDGAGGGPRIRWLSLVKFKDQLVGDLLASYDARALTAEILHDRYLALASEGKPRIAVFDLVTDELVHVFESPSRLDVIQRLLMTDDGRYLVQLNTDGGLQIYSMDARKRIAGGRFIDDEIVFFDDRGYYGGTPEGAHYVFLKFPGVPGQHSFYQFRAALNRPDLIRTLLKDGKLEATEPQLPAPPLASFTWTGSEAPQNRRDLRLSITASAEAGLASLRVFVDGRLVREEQVSGAQAARDITLSVPAATRWVTVQAIDAKGIESVASAASLKPSREARSQGRLFALAVGTDRYGDKGLPTLKYARADASTFLKAVQSAEGHAYRSVIAEPMLDEPDLKARVGKRLEAIAREATSADTIMLFVAAHGVLDNAGRFYVASSQTRLDDLAATAIPSDLIATALAGTKARVVVFLDTCHSGAATGLASNDDAVAGFLDRRSAVTIIAAAKGRQESQERRDIAGGVFTRALEQAIAENRRATDTNGNGAVELSELYGALKRRVVEQTQGAQTPWIARNNMVGEIPLF